jgi:hypothetical protein
MIILDGSEVQRSSWRRFKDTHSVTKTESVVRSANGANYDRLPVPRTTYDPTNLFRINQNISPAT